MESFVDCGISELRAFIRYALPSERGAGKLGNIGTKQEIISALIAAGSTFDDLENWRAAERAKAPAGTSADVLGALEALKAAFLNSQQPKTEAPQIDEKQVEAIAENVYKRFNPPRVVEVRRVDGSSAKLGAVHAKTADIIRAAAAGVHCLLVGPAGSGKTTACEKVAEALNVQFYPVSLGPQTTKSDLIGFIDATGNYHDTALRRAFENGGLLLLDEIDASNPGVLTTINSLLANGYCTFPDKVVKKHDDFHCVAAANTYGRGADRQYCGRQALDAATLDRFKAIIDFDYDENFELSLVGDDPQAVKWCKHVQALRHAADSLKMRVVISPRASISGARLLAAGFEWAEVEKMAIFGGIPADQETKIRENAVEE